MRQFEDQNFIDDLLSLVRCAGQSIMDIYRKVEIETTLKADQSPLTEADLAAHQSLAAGLLRLTPEIPVVSEEDKGSMQYRAKDNMFWLIDPLDGTKEFLSRNGEFTVNVAFIWQGKAHFGVVYAPAFDQMYWGGASLGAYRAEAAQPMPIRLHVNHTVQSPIKVVASKSHLNEATSDFIEKLGDVMLVQAGSSLKICRVAEGSADIYPRLAPTCEWDTAAAQAVLEGAGGVLVDTNKQPLTYGKEDVLNPSFIAACTPDIIPI